MLDRHRLSMFHVATEPFVDPSDGRSKRVIYSTRTSRVKTVDADAWHHVEQGHWDALPHEFSTSLRAMKVLVPDDEDETRAVLDENVGAAKSHDVLYMAVQPTASCQLGCGYCGQLHRSVLLGAEDQRRLVDRVKEKLSAGTFRTLEIAWFGGEPLEGLSVMRALSPEFHRLAKEAGCAFISRMATNGLALTPEVATEVVRTHGVTYLEITLDGTSEFHDARRHRKGGAPTFETIYRNMADLARRDDLDVEVGVRCNVDSRNREGVIPLLRKLAADGLHTRLHRCYVAPVHSWGNDADRLTGDAEEFAALQIEWFVEMARLGFPLDLIPGRVQITCMVQKPKSELVDAYGHLFNCTEVSQVPAYEVRVAGKAGHRNTFSLGSLEKPPAADAPQPFADFFDRARRGEVPCGTCRMLPVCGGACPKLWQEGKVPCPTAKHNIEQRLVLHHLSSLGKIG